MNNKSILRKKSGRISLGITAAMALTLTGCSDSSGSGSNDNYQTYLYEDINADYIAICKDAANTRVKNDDCKDSSSQHASWYYVPLYNDSTNPIPKIGDSVEGRGVEKKEEGKAHRESSGKMNTSDDKYVLVQANEKYGFKLSDSDIDADYVEVCVDKDGNRVDPDECGANNATTSNSGGMNGGFMFWYLPLFNNASTYVPPVGSQVNGNNAIKNKSQLPTGSKIGSAPIGGLNNAHSTKTSSSNPNAVSRGSSSNSGKSSSSVSRGGFGSSGKGGSGA